MFYPLLFASSVTLWVSVSYLWTWPRGHIVSGRERIHSLEPGLWWAACPCNQLSQGQPGLRLVRVEYPGTFRCSVFPLRVPGNPLAEIASACVIQNLGLSKGSEALL